MLLLIRKFWVSGLVLFFVVVCLFVLIKKKIIIQLLLALKSSCVSPGSRYKWYSPDCTKMKSDEQVTRLRTYRQRVYNDVFILLMIHCTDSPML